MSVHAKRRLALEAVLETAGHDAALITQRANIRYLSGFTGSSGALLIARSGASTLLTDFRYDEQANDEVQGPTRICITRGVWMATLPDVIGDQTRSVAFESDHLTVADHQRLVEAIPDVDCAPITDLVGGLRRSKDATEIEAIERAVSVAEEALERTLAAIDWHDRPTEQRVAGLLESELRQGGSETLPFEVIAAGGPRTALPHATPTDRCIEAGDLVLLDFGARVDGYCSDITRTFVVGTPEYWQATIHRQVLEAQTLGRAAVTSGAACRDVDAVTRGVLVRHEVDRYFGHSTGHGIGLEVHEGPSLSSKSEDTLVPGNVVTLEPGVYLPNQGGVRIEDDVLVGEEGPRTLTNLPRELIQL